MASKKVRVNVSVRDGKLIAVGNHGKAPFVCAVPIEGVPEGPVDFGTDNPALKEGLTNLEQKINNRVQLKEDLKLVRETVEQTRAGDQRAKSYIIECRNAALAGGRQARYMLALIDKYIDEHPFKAPRWFDRFRRSSVGSDQPDYSESAATSLQKAIWNPTLFATAVVTWVPLLETNIAAVILANGPDLDTAAFRAVILECPEEQRSSVRASIRKLDSNRIGGALRTAQRLQGLRKGAPLKSFSKAVAWEHGY